MNTTQKDYRFASVATLVWSIWGLFLAYVLFASLGEYLQSWPEGSHNPGGPYYYTWRNSDGQIDMFKWGMWELRALKIAALWASATVVVPGVLSFVAWSFLRPRGV